MKASLGKRALSLMLFAAMLLTFMGELAPRAQAVSGTTYYVSFNHGNDGNTGLSEAQAWKTFDHINARAFQPGDRILLDRGSTWDNAQLSPKGSGTVGAPIVIDMYGSGSGKPRINANGMDWDSGFIYNENITVDANRKWNAAVVFYNQQYWEINNLEITNFSAIERAYTRYNSSGGTESVNIIPPKYGILVVGKDAGVLRHMYVTDCYVHGINGRYTSEAGIGRGAIVYLIRGNAVPTRWDDIIVSDNRVGNRGDYEFGLKVADKQPSVGHYGVVFHGSNVGGSGRFPNESGVNENATSFTDRYSTNIIVRNNYFQDVGNAVICFGAVENGIAERNISDHCNSGLNGNVPIWWHDTKNVICQYNEVYDSGASTSKEDSQAFDADIGALYNVVQYNYTHDNPSGSFFECDAGSLYETHYRYNLSVNDGNGANSHGNGAVITYQSSANQNSRMYLYNNDFFIGSGKTSLIGNHWGGANAHKPHYLYNNLIYDNGAGNNSSISGAAGIAYQAGFLSSTNFDSNYYGGTRAAQVNPGAAIDANAVTGGELNIGGVDASMNRDLAGNTGWAQVDSYKRTEGGVLENAGRNIPYNGGKDLYGNYVSPFGKPSIGAHETNAATAVPDGYKVLSFTDGDKSLYNQTVEGVKFVTNGWAIKGGELAMNKTGLSAMQVKLTISAGYTFYGFSAKALNAGKIVAAFNGKEQTYYLSGTKNAYLTGYTAIPGADTVLTLDLYSPYGVENIRLDDLIITSKRPAVPEGPQKENVVLGKLATQSGGTASAAYGNDGAPIYSATGDNLGAGNTDTGPYWWRVDLGVKHTLSAVEVEWHDQWSGAHKDEDSDIAEDWKYKIEYSNNGMDWGILADYTAETPYTDPAASRVQNTAVSNITARYLKLTITGTPSGKPAARYMFAEFRAFGEPVSGTLGSNAAQGKTPVYQNGGSSAAANGNDGSISTSAGNTSMSGYSVTNPWIWGVQLDATKGIDIGKIEIVWPGLKGDSGTGAYNGYEMPKDWKYKIQYTSSGSLSDPYNSSNWVDLVDYSVRSPYTDYDLLTRDWDAADDSTGVQSHNVAINAKALRILVTGTPSGRGTAWITMAEFRAYEQTASATVDIARTTNKSGKAVLTQSGGSSAAANAVQFDGVRTVFGNGTGAGNTGGSSNALGVAGAKYAWQIDFGSVYEISGVATCWNPEADNTNQTAPLDWKYQILASSDNATWTVVVDYKTTTPYSHVSRANSVYQEVSGLNIRARYMKVAVFSPPAAFPGFWYTLWQFRAFGAQSDAIPGLPNAAAGKYAYQNMSLNGRPEAPDDPIFAGKQLNVATAGLTGRAFYATDGNTSTYAGNTNLDTGNPEYWLAVDLDALYSVYGFEVEWDGANRDWKYVVESSRDGKVWTAVPGADFTLTAHTGAAQALQGIILENSALGRFFRVRVTGKHTAEDIPVRLAEFRVFGLKHSEPGTNVALGKPASGTLNNPGRAVDGNTTNSGWAGQASDGQPWGLHGEGQVTRDLVVDLGAIYDLNEVRVQFEDMELVPNYNFTSYDALAASAGVGTTGYAAQAGTGKNHAEAIKYIVEYSTDRYTWETLWDYSDGNPCVPVEIREEIADGGLSDIYDNNASVRQGWNYVPWKYDTSDAATVEARYLRVTMKGVPAERRMSQYVIAELSAFGAFNRDGGAADIGEDLDNIAYGKPVLPLNVSGVEIVDAGAANLTDLTQGTAWTANGSSRPRIDLGLVYQVTGVVLDFPSDSGAGGVSVYYSEDGMSWNSTSLELTAPTGGGAVSAAIGESFRAHYFKICADSGVKITDFKAQGSEVKAAPKTVMVLAPHPDDEALMAGGVLKRAIDNGDRVYVLVATLGDYNGTGSTGSGGQARMRETISAMQVLGVPVENLIFLTYPDMGGLDQFSPQVYTDSAMYQMFIAKDPKEVFKGRSGQAQTYNGVSPSWHYRRHGVQAAYTRENFLGDMQDAISYAMPDEIYTTSRYDLHADHATIGLFAGEAIINIRKATPSFDPVVHEALIHSCAGDASWPILNKDASGILPFEMPKGLETKTMLDWNKRVSVTVPEAAQVVPFSKNLKTQSLNQYTSQVSDWIRSFAKYDEVFWARKYDSIGYFATATASSEKPGDFDTSAGKAIDGIRDGYSTSLIGSSPKVTHNRFPYAEWVSNGDGNAAWLQLDWDGTAVVSAVTLYDRPDTSVQITGGKLIFADGSEIAVGALPNDGRPLAITLPTPKATSSMKFAVTSCIGADIGLAEIEVQGMVMPDTAYTVTLPTGEGYTAAVQPGSDSLVAEGGSYSFAVTLDEGYTRSTPVVKSNNVVLTAVEGVYTISNITANQTVTVEGVEKNRYTVTFVAGGSANQIETVEHGGNLAVSAFPAVPSKAGYTVAWNKTEDFTNVTGDATVTAVYTANSYTVTFDSNGGEVDPASVAVTYDAAYGALPAPTHSDVDMIFDGWFTRLESGARVEDATVVTTAGDHILYARWRDGDTSPAPTAIVSGMPEKVVLPYTGAEIELRVEEQPTYTYQWRTGTDGSAWTDLQGETGAVYTIPASDIFVANSGRQYLCAVINTVTGQKPNTVESAPVTLVVEEVPKSGEKEITAFSINNIAGVIDQAARTIAVTLPAGSDVTVLTPAVTVSAHATVSPSGAQNFTEPVVYMVMAEDGTSQVYTVTVAVEEPSGPISVTGVTLGHENMLVYKGNQAQLTATVAPADATDKAVAWSSSDEKVATVDEKGLVTALSDGMATITVTTKDGSHTTSCTVTVETYVAPSYTPPTPTAKTETKKNEDGSTTKTVTDLKTRVVTATTIWPDGTTLETVMDKEGKSTSEVTLPKGKDSITVTIPAQATTPGTVAVIVKPDGTREIVKNCVVTEDGMRVTLTKGAKLEIVDNTKRFIDVERTDWFDSSVQFVASRELFNGAGGDTFSPNGSTSRAMLMTVLARLDGKDTTKDETWYSAGMEWAVANGVSDGMNPEADITREQFAVMLYRYAGAQKTGGRLDGFSDADRVSAWAGEAIAWAVEAGIIWGTAGRLNPTDHATRAEVATMLARFVVLVNQA